MVHLKDTVFEEAAGGIIWKADNEAFQAYAFVEALKNDVYDPLQTFWDENFAKQSAYIWSSTD